MSTNHSELETVVVEFNRVIKRLPLSIVVVVFEESDSRLPALIIKRDEFFIKLELRDRSATEEDIPDEDIDLSIRTVVALTRKFSNFKLSWFDKIAVYCREYVLSHSVVRDQSHFYYSPAMKLCAFFYHFHNERIVVGADFHKASLKFLSIMLHEPESNVNQLIIRNKCCSWYFLKKREIHRLDRGLRLAKTHHWNQRRLYQHYANTSGGSRVLVSIHMGDFLGALKEVANAGSDKRQVISLRQGNDVEKIKKIIDREERHEVVQRANASPANIVSKLRKGNVTLVALTDLGRQFGETETVSFMGVAMDFVKGPVLMALLGRADIVPIVSFENAGVDYIEMGPVLPPDAKSHDTIHAAVQSNMQKLFMWFERYVRKYPEQWKYLPDSHTFVSN